MCDHIKGGAADPLVQQYADEAARQFAGISAVEGDAALAACAWWWCKTYIEFVHHERLLRKFLGEAGHRQGLISPDALVRMDRPKGDCAIFTDCLLSFLRVYGVPYELVTVKVDLREPQEYSHVYAYAVLPDGRRFPLDASHGDYPGWQVPSRDINFAQNESGSPAVQVWDENGNKVPDRGSRFDGLGAYGLRGRGMGALVCLDPNDTSSCYDDGSGSTPPAGGSVDLCSLYPAMCAGSASSSGAPSWSNPNTQIVVPQQGTQQWAALAAQLVKGGFDLAKLNAIPAGTIINPSGQIIRQNPGYSVPAGPVGGSFNVGTGGSLLPWLGIAAALGLGLAFAGGRR